MSGAIERKFRNPEHAEIYRAALRTFSHNAVDLFTDCPSRERAEWLCDTFFTGRAKHFFFGDSVIEDAFLENYVLYKNEGEFPVAKIFNYPELEEKAEKLLAKNLKALFLDMRRETCTLW